MYAFMIVVIVIIAAMTLALLVGIVMALQTYGWPIKLSSSSLDN
jgi:hypothetical protein